MTMHFRWNDEADAMMRSIAEEGGSANEAADVLSRHYKVTISRNACIGRGQRRGIVFASQPGRQAPLDAETNDPALVAARMRKINADLQNRPKPKTVVPRRADKKMLSPVVIQAAITCVAKCLGEPPQTIVAMSARVRKLAFFALREAFPATDGRHLAMAFGYKDAQKAARNVNDARATEWFKQLDADRVVIDETVGLLVADQYGARAA